MAGRRDEARWNGGSTAPQIFADFRFFFDDMSVGIDSSEIAHGFILLTFCWCTINSLKESELAAQGRLLRYRFPFFSWQRRRNHSAFSSLYAGMIQRHKPARPLILVAGLLVSRRNCFLPEQSSPDLNFFVIAKT